MTREYFTTKKIEGIMHMYRNIRTALGIGIGAADDDPGPAADNHICSVNGRYVTTSVRAQPEL